MIIIVSKEEKELIQRLRSLDTLESVAPLNVKILDLKKQISQLEIDKSKKEEEYAKQERELRHMIGLEKKRQEFEIEQAKKETSLKLREENLANEKKEFERQLQFNTERFKTMETYLKDMMKEILGRLPNINVKMRSEVK